jgi:hypothetical protein
MLGDILTAKGLISPSDVERAFERQKQSGGRLGDNLVALGLISQEQIEAVLSEAPRLPRSIEETGVPFADLFRLMMKTIYAENLEAPSSVSESLRLPYALIGQMLKEAADRKLVEPLTSAGGAGAETRFALTGAGRSYAMDSLEQSQYTGAAPVSLESFARRVLHQKITNERIDRDIIDAHFADLVITEEFVQQIGPAINSGRTVLLYGPPGNGKTSVAERVAKMFSDVIYVPYAVAIEGQVMKVFDGSLHKAVESETTEQPRTLRRDPIDRRWVPCERPIVVTGGELTLEMLDLQYNHAAKFYEAPMHVKALNGTFIIDDFGRQLVSPEDLLNRWIVPLQSRVDYLKLHTGKSFQFPFDELVIFSTNLSPADLMDPAFLRRIPYKLPTEAPERDQFAAIFRAVADGRELEVTDEMVDLVVDFLREKNDFPLACYQPKFIVDQITDACKYDGLPPRFTPALVLQALGNLYTKDSPGFGVTRAMREAGHAGAGDAYAMTAAKGGGAAEKVRAHALT